MSTRPKLPKQLSSIGEFKLGLPFGEGNHALIRCGKSKVDGKEVVIKELAKKSPRTNGLLRQEATIMDGLSHRNLVKLHMHVETQDRLFLVMHYAKGGDLLDAVMGSRNKRLSSAVAKKWFAQLLLGVDYLHKNNIVHMDLKPDNVFVDESFNILIGDYGLSRFYNPHMRSLVARPGTLHYSAPECFSRWLVEQGWGDASIYFQELGVPLTRKGDVVVYGTELDVWALGVCLYVMLTGKYPFWGTGNTQAEEDYATIETILFQEAPRWPFWIESDCVDMLCAIFNKNPHERITVAELMKHRWVKEQVEEEIRIIESAMQSGYAPTVSSPLVSPSASPRHSPIPSPLHSPHISPLPSPLVSPHGSPVRSPLVSPSGSPHASPHSSPRFTPSRTGSSSPRTQKKAKVPMLQKRFSRSNLMRLHQHKAHLDLLAAAGGKKSSSEKKPRGALRKESKRKGSIPEGNPRAALVRMHEAYSRFSDLHTALETARARKGDPGAVA